MKDDDSKAWKLAQIPSLIEQIELNNGMIALHEKGGSPAMIRQYERLNQSFFDELSAILAEFGFSIESKNSKSTSLKPTRKQAEKQLAAAV